MAINAQNAYVGSMPIDGGVFFAAKLGTKLPKTATEALDPKFRDHGAIAEDGVSISPERSTTPVKMLGGGDFTEIQTEYTETIAITLLEDFNDNVIKTAFGEANVVAEDKNEDGRNVTIYHTEAPLPLQSFVIKTVSGEKAKTYVAEVARVTSVERTPDVHSDVSRTTLNIKVFKSTSKELKGAYVVELRNDATPQTKEDKNTETAGTEENQ